MFHPVEKLGSSSRWASAHYVLAFAGWTDVAREAPMKKITMDADEAGFVGFFCGLSGKGLCLLVRREERHAKH